MELQHRAIHQILDQAARQHSTLIAISDDKVRWTYSELDDCSKRFALWLHSLGVEPGERVACYFRDQAMTAAALYGTSRAMATFVPINLQTKPFQLEYLLRDADVRAVVVEDEFSVSVLAPMTTAVVKTLADFRSYTPSALAHDWPIHESSPALLIYTSGSSTGRPRAVACPHNSVIFATCSISQSLHYRSSDIIYARIPFSFDYGLYQIFLCTFSGAELAIASDPNTSATLREIRDREVTVVPVVPSLAGVIVALARRSPPQTKVRMFTNTGEALSRVAIEGLREYFPDAKVVLMFGTTECKRITIAEPDIDLELPETVGKAIPGTQVRVVDEFRQRLEPGQVGEIVSAGPHVMAGYWRDQELTDRVFSRDADGTQLIYTGDYGYLDGDGNLYFQGRRGDRFKRRGVRMSTAEVEFATRHVPGVRDAAAFQLKATDELVVVVVVDADIGEAQVLRELAERIDNAKVPDRCIRFTALPLTPNGKIDKIAVRKYLEWRET